MSIGAERKIHSFKSNVTCLLGPLLWKSRLGLQLLLSLIPEEQKGQRSHV